MKHPNTLLMALSLLVATGASAFGQTLQVNWAQTYGTLTNGDDCTRAVIADAVGNCYIAGRADDDSMLTIKYGVDGYAEWAVRYRNPGVIQNAATAIALDNGGNVYVAGYLGADYATLKYDADGNRLWVSLFREPSSSESVVHAIAVDNAGYVYVTGHSKTAAGADIVCATIKYNASSGAGVWTNRYAGHALGNAIAVDGSGNVLVAGGENHTRTNEDYLIIKYNSVGSQLWVQTYDGPTSTHDGSDEAKAVALDASGNVYVTGAMTGDTPLYGTLKYDSNGNLLWADMPWYMYMRLRGSANAIALDTAGHAFVTGGGTNRDFLTVKYDTDGTRLWTAHYRYTNSGTVYYNQASGIAVDSDGSAYITGTSSYYSYPYSYLSLATLKYAAGGQQVWVQRQEDVFYRNDSETIDTSVTAPHLALDNAAGVYVAGTGRSSGMEACLTWKYLQLYPPSITTQPQSQAVLLGQDVNLTVVAHGTDPLSYRWYFNSNLLSGATASTLPLPNIQPASAGYYFVVITNLYGSITSSVATVTVSTVALGDALDNNTLEWDTSSFALWFGQAHVTHDGVDAAQSGDITNWQDSVLETTVTGPGMLTFWWKVSSETNFDYLSFGVGGVEQRAICGEVGWQQYAVYLASGSHSVSWVYEKDGSVSSGQDAGWVDQVSFVSGNGGPFVNVPPANQSVLCGAAATFTVSAAGSPTLHYQWQFNGANLAASDSATLSLTNARFAQAGDYRVVVTNAYGSVTSSVASLTVTGVALNVALDNSTLSWSAAGWFGQVYTTHDGVDAAQSGAITDSQTSYFQTTVTGPGTLTYWWKVSSEESYDFLQFVDNGVIESSISGEAGWLLQTNYVGAGSHTLSWVYAKDGSVSRGQDAGWVDQVAFVSGGTAPGVAIPPANQTVSRGGTATFDVTAIGTPPLAYQWLFNGGSYSGATGASLTLTNLQPSQAGTYQVVITNAYGAITSSVASLTVSVVPLSDALDTSALAWTTSGDGLWFGQVHTTWDNVDAAQSGAITNSQSSVLQTTILGPGTFSFWWKVSSETNYDYLRFIVDGAEQFKISGEVDWQQKTASLAAGTHTLQWSYTKDGSLSRGQDVGWVDNVIFVAKPFITTQPLSQTVVAGTTASFSVVAGSTAPVGYQWRYNGGNLAGANAASLAITNVQPVNDGNYDVVIANSYGSITSAPAVLTVNYQLTVTKSGGGGVYYSPSQSSYVPNSTVQLTAVPADGWNFSAWSGDASSSAPRFSLVMNTNKHLIVTFVSTVASVIVDNTNATFSGTWSTGTGYHCFGSDYRYTAADASGDYGVFRPNLPRAGNYDIASLWPALTTGTAHAYYGLVTSSGHTNVYEVDQSVEGGRWRLITSSVSLSAGTTAYMAIVNASTREGCYLFADAIRFAWSTQQPLAPYIDSISLASDQVTLIWLAESGETYRVQYKTNLTDTTWTDVAGDVTASSLMATNTHTVPANPPQRFYRVARLP